MSRQFENRRNNGQKDSYDYGIESAIRDWNNRRTEEQKNSTVCEQ